VTNPSRDTSGPNWRKSSRSGTNGGNCVEVAFTPENVAMRDSKNPHGPVLNFTWSDWRSFHASTRSGRFEQH
jgi:hypothetical protein